MRIAVGGFQHETNTFAPARATWREFAEGGAFPPLQEGAALPDAFVGMNLPIAGALAALREAGHDPVPLVWAAATPSAQVTEEAYERIAGRMLDALAAAGAVDGVYLDLHGAMVAEHLDDGEGELLARLRRRVGGQVPVVASLDLHANVTPAMVEVADALVAYRTYPHVDMAATGARAARLLMRLAGGSGRLHKRLTHLPFLIPINWQATTMDPARSLYRRLAEIEREEGATLSFTPGFPAADFPCCGPAVLAYAGDAAAADRAAARLSDEITKAEKGFAGRIYTPDEAVARALARRGTRPVVLADTQDNPGAGGTSDTTGLLAALVRADAADAALAVMVDPEAAAAAHRAGVGAKVTLALGGKSGIPGDAPFQASFAVEHLADGAFTGTGPMWGGAQLRLGPMARLRVGGVRVVVASRKAQAADQSIFRHVGIEPTAQHILALKSSVHFRADFEPISGEILVVAAPGAMAADPAALPFRRLRPGIRLRPLGPAFGATGP